LLMRVNKKSKRQKRHEKATGGFNEPVELRKIT
jgi:hypothetical protein